MGSSIFLWVERQLASGAWEMVKREENRKTSWQPWLRDYESRDSSGEEFAKAVLEGLRSLPTKPPPDLVRYLANAAVMGLPTSSNTWEVGKNYTLFAILADHRNRDAAGARIYEHFISTPRGLPSDVSDRVLADATDGFFAGGSQPTRAQRIDFLLKDVVAPSWVTVEELMAVDWASATDGDGVVGEEGDFLTVLREEIVPIGPPDRVRLVFFFDC